MRTLRFVPLIAFGVAVLPNVAMASCVPGTKPSYQDISAIYFRSAGVSEPIAIHRDDVAEPGVCPTTMVLYSSPSDLDMGGRAACLPSTSGKVVGCCGATSSDTVDAPQLVFNRLVTTLQRDHFYDVAHSLKTTAAVGDAFYSVTVMTCGAQPHDKSVEIAFVGPPQPGPNTTILAVAIPYGSLAEAVNGSEVVTLFDDFTRAIYQSKWTVKDIW